MLGVSSESGTLKLQMSPVEAKVAGPNAELPTKLRGKRSPKERYLQTRIPPPSAQLPRPQRKLLQTHMPRLILPE